MASAQYGMLLGVVMVVALRVVPQPAGAVILWGLLCVQLGWFSVVCWRRTGLPFATAAMINGSVGSLSLVVLALMGQPFPALAPASWVFFASSALLGPLFLLIESRVNRDKWIQWAHHMQHKNAWDIISGRHIPQLRGGGA